MKIILNGEAYETDCRNVQGLLSELDIKPDFVAVELNRKIIKKAEFESTSINEQDKIEIVKFVGGG